jgi:hypothetical protein
VGETLSLFTTTLYRSLSVEARPEHLIGDAGTVLLCEILAIGPTEWSNRIIGVDGSLLPKSGA